MSLRCRRPLLEVSTPQTIDQENRARSAVSPRTRERPGCIGTASWSMRLSTIDVILCGVELHFFGGSLPSHPLGAPTGTGTPSGVPRRRRRPSPVRRAPPSRSGMRAPRRALPARAGRAAGAGRRGARAGTPAPGAAATVEWPWGQARREGNYHGELTSGS